MRTSRYTFSPGYKAEVSGGRVTRIRAVPAVKDSSKTIIASFSQTSNNRVHENMMLKVYNLFQQTLIYKAKMYLLNDDKWVETSILPVEGVLSGYEIWNDIIISIAIGEWELK